MFQLTALPFILTAEDEPYTQSSANWKLSGQNLTEVKAMGEILNLSETEVGKILKSESAFSSPLVVELIEADESILVKSISGNTTLYLATAEIDPEQWILEAYLTRWASWNGISKQPPSWLVRALEVRLQVNRMRSFVNVLLLELRKESVVPTLAQLSNAEIKFPRQWYFLLLKFIREGGGNREEFQLLLKQYWKSGYNWTQLSVFYRNQYSQLNPAELELLWKTFISEELNRVNSRFLSEQDSVELLNRLGQVSVSMRGKEEVILPETWYLNRDNAALREELLGKENDLSVVILRIHPYYYNVCHSLHFTIAAILNNDLESFRVHAVRYRQDLLDAQQLVYETDQLLKRICE